SQVAGAPVSPNVTVQVAPVQDGVGPACAEAAGASSTAPDSAGTASAAAASAVIAGAPRGRRNRRRADADVLVIVGTRLITASKEAGPYGTTPEAADPPRPAGRSQNSRGQASTETYGPP